MVLSSLEGLFLLKISGQTRRYLFCCEEGLMVTNSAIENAYQIIAQICFVWGGQKHHKSFFV